MKTLLAVTVATVGLLTNPALAGSTQAPAPDPILAPATIAPSGPDWTGFYLGAQAGYADVEANVPGISGDGVIGGIIAGYDYDFGTFVIGGGLDYDFSDINIATAPPALTLENVFRAKLRGGYKIGDGLLYATGGYAQADTDLLGSEDGYFIGAGYEHLISDQFSIGGELLYHEFDSYGGTAVDVDATTFQLRGAFRF
jgi:hypothetical protein